MTFDSFMSLFKRERWINDIFRLDVTELPTWQKHVIVIVQRLLSSWLRFRESRSDIQVGALSFITFLSLVPILAFSFSIIKTVGLHKQLQTQVINPLLDQWVDPGKAPELRGAIEQMLAFVERTDFASLGAIGFLTLGYAVIRLLGSAERAMNGLWGIRSSRPLMRKISDYLSVAIIVPIIMIVAGTTSHWLENFQTMLGVWSSMGLRLAVLFTLWIGFGLLYYLLPNTRVQASAAWRGGILGGTLWLLIHQALINFQVGVAGYNAIYAGFSVLPVFMLWIYGGWWAIIIGASFAAGHQLSEQHRRRILGESTSLRYQERLAMRIMVAVGHRYRSENTCVGIEDLTEALGEERVVVDLVLSQLELANLLVRTQLDSIVLSRDINAVRMSQVMDALKGPKEIDEDVFSELLDNATECSHVSSVNSMMEEFQETIAQHSANLTLHEMCNVLNDPTDWESEPQDVLSISSDGLSSK